MNGYERILKAIKREEPDHVPYWELTISPDLIKKIYGDIPYEEFVSREEWDGVCAGENWNKRWISSEHFYDEWGILWGVGPGGSNYPINGPLEGKRKIDIHTPDPDDPQRFQKLKGLVKAFKGEKAIVFIGHEAFEFSHYLVGGIDKLLLDYILDPDWILELSEFVWNYQKRVLSNAVSIGADILLTGDDYAGKNGPLISPDHFKTFLLPYLQRAVGLAHDLGVPFIKHCDGRLDYILDLLVSIGIDGVHPLEPMAGMKIGDVKERYGSKIALVGNIDCSELLCREDEAMVVEAVKETLAKAASGGGYILSSSNSLHGGIRPQNYHAMRQSLKKFGGYPLNKEMLSMYKEKDYMTLLR